MTMDIQTALAEAGKFARFVKAFERIDEVLEAASATAQVEVELQAAVVKARATLDDLRTQIANSAAALEATRLQCQDKRHAAGVEALAIKDAAGDQAEKILADAKAKADGLELAALSKANDAEARATDAEVRAADAEKRKDEAEATLAELRAAIAKIKGA